MWVGKWIRKCLWHAMAHVFSSPGTIIASWPRLVVALSDARLLARLVFYGELSEGTEREAGYVAHFSLDILSTELLWAFALCRIMPKQRICPFKPGPSKKRLFHTPRIFKPKALEAEEWIGWIGMPGFVSCASGTLWVGADYLLGSLWALAVLDGGEGPQSAPWFGLQLEGRSLPNKLDANDGTSTVLTNSVIFMRQFRENPSLAGDTWWNWWWLQFLPSAHAS